jgi:hypothetical protein
MDRGARRYALAIMVALAIVAAGCSRSAAPDRTTGATAPGAAASVDAAASASTDPGASASAGPLPSAIAYAIQQRKAFGLRADLAWVEQVAADPTARIFPLDFLMTPDEATAFEARQASFDEVVAAVQADAATVPDEFGGVYLDQQNGHVVAQFTAHLEQHRQAILDRLGKAGPLVVEQVTYTEADLRALQDRISADWGWLKSLDAAATGVGVDTIKNCTVLEISSKNPDAPALILAHYGQPAGKLRVESDGTGVVLMPRGWIDVSVKVATGASPPPGGWMIDMVGDGPGQWGSEVGWGVLPGGVAKVPATVGGWTVTLSDDQQKVVATGHATVVAGQHVKLVIRAP